MSIRPASHINQPSEATPDFRSTGQAPESMQLLRVADVCRLLRISKPTLWRLRRANDFPEPTEVTARVIAWRKTEIDLWLSGRSSSQRTAARKRQYLPALDAAGAIGVGDALAQYRR